MVRPAALLLFLVVAPLANAAPAPAPKSTTPAPAPASTAPSSTPARPKPTTARPPASSDRLDGIAAVVNDDVILESDVEEQLYLFLSQAHARPDSSTLDTLRTQVLNQLIDFKLLVGEAKRQGVTLSPSDSKEIDAKVEESLQDTKSRFESEEAYHAQLEKENTSEAKLREKYHEDLERQRLAERLIDRNMPRKPVPPAEAEAYFNAHPEKFPKQPAEVKIQVIQIVPHADSVADARARAKALEVRKRLLAGEKFAKVALDVSDDPNTARAGGDLGYLPRGALDKTLDNAAFTLKLHTLSEPLRSAVGWHIIEVLERDTLKTRAGKDSLDRQGKPALEAQVRHILIRVPITDADVARARQRAEQVRAQAAKGVDFATLVKRYSEYDGQAAADGDLGFISVSAFQPAIREGIDSTAVGSVTQVLENNVGLNIFKVNDRRPERPYKLDEIRSELPEVVAQMKQREKIDEWVKGLRSKAHIEIRSS